MSGVRGFVDQRHGFNCPRSIESVKRASGVEQERKGSSMARAKVKEISYFKIRNLVDPNQWRCHIDTTDGDHYQGEGYTKGEAKQNALDAMRAND